MNLKKLPSEVAAMLNDVLIDEYNAFYLYRAAHSYCKNVGFFLAADYFAKESADELEHAKKIESFLTDWNMIPELPKVETPQLTFKGLMEILQKAYKMEYDLYEKYEDISIKIFDLGDICVFDFLAFFRGIQKDSVAEYSDKLNLLEGVDDSKLNLLLLEEKLFE